MPDTTDLPRSSADEISLLDLLVVIAESWKLLLLVPLLVGALAFAYAHFSRTETFTSQAIVELNVSQSAALRSVSVVDTVARDSQWFALHDDNIVRAISALEDSFGYERISGSQLFALSFVHDDPDMPPRMLTLILEELFAAAQSNPSLALDSEIVIQPPTGASGRTEGGTRRPVLMAALAFFATGFILLIFVFAREGFRRAAAEPEGAEKINRIRRAFGLNRNRE